MKSVLIIIYIISGGWPNQQMTSQQVPQPDRLTCLLEGMRLESHNERPGNDMMVKTSCVNVE